MGVTCGPHKAKSMHGTKGLNVVVLAALGRKQTAYHSEKRPVSMVSDLQGCMISQCICWVHGHLSTSVNI